MMLASLLIFNLFYCIINAVIVHDSYEGVPTTNEKWKKYEKENTTEICAIAFEPCDETEYRRPDGSCNNLNYPSRGPFHTPNWRVLPANYSSNFEPRKAKSGQPLKVPRHIRSLLLKVGESISQQFATSVSFFHEFVGGDTVSIHDVQNFVFNETNCCEPEGKNNYWCIPNEAPEDDHVHRFSGIRCFNNTRPQSFQNMGCTRNDTVPSRISYATTFFDLSMLYDFAKGVINRTRAFKGGKLKVEVVDGKSFPSDAEPDTTCFIKQAIETDCVRYVPNGLIGTNIFTTIFWRFHNLIADRLGKLNPCWDDNKLFNVAQDINIAIYAQILFYEYYGLVLGKRNLIRDGVLIAGTGFRDLYDDKVVPQVAIEFPYIQRWFHTTQEGMMRMYDENDRFVKEKSIVNYSLRTQDLAIENNSLHITHCLYMQPSGDFNDVVHPEVSEIALGFYQKVFDVPSADLHKGRYLGLAPYIQYRDYCTNYTKKHETFDDLRDIINPEKLEILREIYQDPIDIEMMAGAWCENKISGGFVPPTVYSLLVAQLKKSLTFDRHWYERHNRPHAFTYNQLQEIRKGCLARLMCDAGDEVTHIQQRAFERIGPTNPKMSCKDIPKIDFSLWKDDSCKAKINDKKV